jgi:hypothetical protein
MVTSAPRPLEGSLPSLPQVLGLSLDETAESGHAKAMIHIMFQIIAPSCTPVPVEIDLESTSTIANSKVALALLLSGADPTAVLEKPRTEPVILGGIAPGQLQLVHMGAILGDHVLLRSLQGMMPAGDTVIPPKTMGEPRLCFTPDPCSSPPLNQVDRSQPHLSSSDGGLFLMVVSTRQLTIFAVLRPVVMDRYAIANSSATGVLAPASGEHLAVRNEITSSEVRFGKVLQDWRGEDGGLPDHGV